MIYIFLLKEEAFHSNIRLYTVPELLATHPALPCSVVKRCKNNVGC